MQTFFFFAKKVYKKGTFFVKKWYIKGQRGGPRGGTSPYKRGGGGARPCPGEFLGQFLAEVITY